MFLAIQAKIDRLSNSLTRTTTDLDSLDAQLAEIRAELLQGASGLEYVKQAREQ